MSTDPQEFFRQNGYYDVPEGISRPRAKKARWGKKSSAGVHPGGLALRGWRARIAIQHWNVPPAFEKSGKALERLGLEEYLRRVQKYYENIGTLKVEHQKELYEREVIRACMKTFETQVRGVRRQEVSSRRNIGHGGGGLFITASEELTLPEDLRSERFMTDIKEHLHRYGVRKERFPVVERWLRAKLTQRWGVKI